MADYTVTVDVVVTDNKLTALENDINSLKTKKIKLNIDTSSAKSKLSTINKQLNNLKPKKIKVTVDTSGAKAKINTLRKQLRELNKEANKQSTRQASATSRADTSRKTTSKSGTTGTTGKSGTSQVVQQANKDLAKLKSIQQQIKSMRFTLSGMDASKDGAAIAKLEQKLHRAQTAYNDFYKTASKNLNANQIKDLNNAFESNIPATKQAVDSYKQLGRMLKEINSIKTASAKLTPSSNIHEYDLLNNRLNTLKKNYSELRSSLNGQMSSGQLSKLDNDVRDAELALSRLKAKMHDDLSLKIRTDGFDSDIAKVQAKMKGLRTVTDDIDKSYRHLNTAKNQTLAAFDNGDIDRAIRKHKDYQQILKKTNNQIDAQRKLQSLSADPSKVSKLDYDIEKALKRYTAAGTEFENKLKSIQARLKSCNATELNGLQNEFDQTIRKADLAGKTTMSFKDRLSNQFSRFAGYFSVATVFMEAAQAVRYMFDSVVGVDTAMTELYRVTDLTSQQYSGLYDNMISSAQQYGSTLTDMISSTAAWSRLGYEANDALGLAEVSAMYQHISDLDYDAAVENLVTGYKGFETELSKTFSGDTVSAVEYVGDVYNELGNNYAITSGQVGDSLTRAASALSLAGNTFTESAAMVTGVTEVTQDPEKAGSAMKILSLRLRGMKGELEEVESGASEGVESVSKMQTQIMNMTGGKVNIFDDNGEFKSTYEIMQGIAEIYDDLSDTEQADLLETIAGKNRANDVAALINNWDRVEAANESAMNASGSAAKEHEAYLDSLQGRIDSLKGSFQAFSATLLESNFLKGLISGATGLFNILDPMIDKLGTLPVLLSTVSGIMYGIKGKGLFFNAQNNASMHFLDQITTRKGARLSEIATAFGTGYSENVRRSSGIIQGIGNGINAARNRITYSDINKLQKYNDALRRGTNAQTAYYQHLSSASMAAKDAATRASGAEVNINKLAASATKGGAAMQRLASGLSLVGNIGATMLATMAISAAITGISKLLTAKKDLAKEIDDVITNYNNAHGELTQGRTEFEDNAERYAELYKGVYQNTGMNKSLTSTEYEEYQQIVNSIAEKTPSLVAGFDAQGNAILNCAGDVEALNKAYDELLIKENDELLNGDGEDYKGVSEISKDLHNAYKDIFPSPADEDWVDSLKEILNSSEIDADTVSEIATNNKNLIAQKLQQAMKDAGETDVEYPSLFGSHHDYSEYIAEVCKAHPDIVKAIVDDFDSELEQEVEPMRTAMQAHLENAFLKGDYDNLADDDEVQALASQLVNGIDSQFIAELNESGGEEAVLGYVDDMLGALNNFDDSQLGQFKNAFTLQDDFLNGDLSYGEYIDGINNFTSFLEKSGLDEELVSQIKLTMSTEEAEESFNALKKRLVKDGLGEDVADNYLRGLSQAELKAAETLIEEMDPDFSKITLDEWDKRVERQARLEVALAYSIDTEAETENLEALSTALSEARSGSGLTMESFEKINSMYSDVAGYNAATLFEETANGINLNNKALSKLEETRVNDILKETKDNVDVLKNEYDDLTKQMEDADAAERATLESKREQIRQQLLDLGAQVTILEGMNSAYAKWQRAESSGNDRDMYENAYTGLQGVEEELSRGWADQGTKEFAKFIFGDSWDEFGTDVVGMQEKFATLDNTIAGTSYSLRDFMTADEDGNLTSEGIFNFFDAVEQKQAELGKNWITYDEDGTMHFDFGQGNDKEIADAFGMSEELLQSYLRAAEDAGFDIKIDGDWTDLENLSDEALAAQDAVNELDGKKYSIDFDSDDASELKSNLDDLKSDTRFFDENGHIKLFDENGKEIEGAKEALTMAQSLQARMGVLDDKYTGLTVEDETFEEPLSKLQEYEQAVNALDVLELDPVTNAETIKELNAQLSDTVDYFKDIRDNNKSLAEDLGIDGMTDEQLNDAVANGEIEIPTTLDLQVDMADSLQAIKDLLMLSTGELSEEEEYEIKLKYGLVTDDEGLEDDAEESGKESGKKAGEAAEKGAEEGVEESNKGVKTGRNASDLVKDGVVSEGLPSFGPVETSYRVIEYTAELDTSAIEEATPEDVEVMVKYLNEGSEALTDEELEIVAKYFPDTSEIDGWTPEEKESFVRFLAETGLIDGLTFEEDGTITFKPDTSEVEDVDVNTNEVEVPLKFGDAPEPEIETTTATIEYDTVVDGEQPEVKDETANITYTSTVEGETPETEGDIQGGSIIYTPEVNGTLPPLTGGQADYTANVDGSLPPLSGGQADYTPNVSGGALPPLTGGIATYTPTVSGGAIPSLDGGIATYTEEFAGATPPPLTGIVTYTGIFPSSAPTITGTVNYVLGSVATPSVVDGTAHAHGTAYAEGTVNKKEGKLSSVKTYAEKLFGRANDRNVGKVNKESKSGRAFKEGDWGTKGSGTALVGELGAELLVRDGKWHLIGEDSAEFVGYKKNDIIFNAEQTRQIFEKGKITHGNTRGKALYSGTAFSSGTGGRRPEYGSSSSSSSGDTTINNTYNYYNDSSGGSGSSSSSGSNGSSGNDSSESEEEFEETVDWIEKAIDRLERAIDQLDTKVESTYRSWSERNKSIYSEIDKIAEEVELQNKAYDRYMKQAKDVGLSSEYVKKVQDGTIDIETVTDEDLKEKIDDYTEWYEKALDCKDAILELQEAQSELYETAFEHVATEFEGYIAVIEHEKDRLEDFIDRSEERGWIVSGEYYKAMIENQKATNKELEKERTKLTEKMNEAVNAGAIKKYSEAWYEMVQEIDDVTMAIEEGNTALIEYANNIRDIEWEVFDFLQDKISNITTEAEFLVDLMSNKKLFEDNGQMTDIGMATMGVHGVAYNVNMYQADLYGEEIKKIDKQIAESPNDEAYDKEMLDRRQELIELQQESIMAAEEEKNAIKDLVEEGINLELDSLDELIDKYLDAIETEKDLYDYQKDVKKQAKEIADLEKQAIAYKGDDSEEAKQKVQELKVSLEEAKEDLQETEYDQYISDQEKLLDDLYTEYETILNERLDNIDALVADMIEQINTNAKGISKTITEQAEAAGATLSNEMKSIWSNVNPDGTPNENSISSIITKYGNDFAGKLTTTNDTLKFIHTNVQRMIGQLNKVAKTNVKAAGESSAGNKPPTNKNNNNKKNNDKKEEPKVTEDDLWKIAAAIWCEPGAGWGNDPYRSTRLIARVGKENAQKVQDIINKHSANGDLYNLWAKNGQNLSKYWYGKYKSGAKDIDKTQMAWTQEGRKKEFIIRPSDGAILTPIAKGDSVLNAAATGNIWNMANNPSDFIKDNLDIGNINVPVNGSSNNTYIQNLDKVVFSMPNVQNYNEFVNALQRDKSFEKLIKSMTVDRLAGGSSLAKTKSVR